MTGRFNFLLTDGRVIAATAAGDTLWYRSGPAGAVVASEPGDDEPGWTEVPDSCVVAATRQQVSVAEMAALDGHARQHQDPEDGRIAIR